MNSENNQITAIGKFTGGFTYSHEVFGERFYQIILKVNRFSGTTDLLPVIISERILDISQDYSGQSIKITGQLRTYNFHEGEKNRVQIFIFAQDIEFLQEDESPARNNDVYLNGFICKPPVFRTTPLGREICDLLIAVNRAYGKSDYIPSIAWGRTARYLSGKKVGSPVTLLGRFQSREYVKYDENGQEETHTAYEFSTMKLI